MGGDDDPVHLGIVAEVVPDALDRAPTPVGAPELEIVHHGPAGEPGDEVDHVGGHARPQERDEVRPDERLRFEPEDRLRRRRRKPDRQVRLEDDDHVGRVLHEPAEASLALALEQVLGERDALEGECDLGRERLQSPAVATNRAARRCVPTGLPRSPPGS